MSEQSSTIDVETDFKKLLTELISQDTIALAVDVEILIWGKELYLSIYEPTDDSEIRSRIRSLCDSIETVQIEDKLVDFDYRIDGYIPSVMSNVGIYIPKQVAGTDITSFTETKIEEGLSSLTSVSEQISDGTPDYQAFSHGETVEDIFEPTIRTVAKDSDFTHEELFKAVNDDIELYIPTEWSCADDRVVIVGSSPSELDVPEALRETVQTIHNRTAERITKDGWEGEDFDVYVSPWALSQQSRNEAPR